MNRTLEERARELRIELRGAVDSDHAYDIILAALTDLSRDYSQRVQELEERLNNSNAWWATRSQRLQDWARAELTDELQERLFAIVANGTASPFENPTYAQQMNMLRAENEALRKALDKYSNAELLGETERCELEALCKDKERLLDYLDCLLHNAWHSDDCKAPEYPCDCGLGPVASKVQAELDAARQLDSKKGEK